MLNEAVTSLLALPGPSPSLSSLLSWVSSSLPALLLLCSLCALPLLLPLLRLLLTQDHLKAEDPRLKALPNTRHRLLGYVHLIPNSNFYSAFRSFIAEHGSPVASHLMGRTTYFFGSPDHARAFFTHPSTKERGDYTSLSRFLGDYSLFGLKQENWARLRHALKPLFHYHNLRHYLLLMNEGAHRTIQRIEEANQVHRDREAEAKREGRLLQVVSQAQTLDVNRLCTKMALEIISRALFSGALQEEIDRLVRIVEEVSYLFALTSLNPLSKFTRPDLYLRYCYLTRILKRDMASLVRQRMNEAQAQAQTQTQTQIGAGVHQQNWEDEPLTQTELALGAEGVPRGRDTAAATILPGPETTDPDASALPRSPASSAFVKYPDLVDHMLEARDPKTNLPLTVEQITTQCMTFYFSGHDTTAPTLAWALWEISKSDEIQAKVHQELVEVMGADRPGENLAPTYEELSRLNYLHWVVKETLRLYSPAPVVSREVGEGLELEGMRFTKGANAYLSIHAIHTSDVYWEEPAKFDPERFSPERSASRHPYAWIPFSMGEKNCIGINFALLEIRAVLAILCWRYKLRPSVDHLPHRVSRLTYSPADGVHVSFTPRETE